MSEISEGALVEAVLAGNTDLYRVLVDRYKGVVFNLAYRMTGSTEDACDISQDTFIRAYQALEKFRIGEKFFTWIYTICLNVTKNHLRQRSRQQRLCQEAHQEAVFQRDLGFAGPEETLLEREEAAYIQGLLCEVPDHYRAAVLLRYQDGLSYDEIATMLGITVSGAKMRVKRGLDKLRGLSEGRSKVEASR